MDDRKLADILIRHHLGSQGLGNDIARKIVRLLNAADADLVAQIAARYATIQSAGYDRGPATTQRLNDLLEAIRAVNHQVYRPLADDLRSTLVDVAGHEVDFTASAMKRAGAPVDLGTTIPSTQFLTTLVVQSPITGRLFDSWTDGLEGKRLDRLEEAVRIGLTNGETTDQIVGRIRGTKAAGYKDGILNRSRQSLQTFTLTANSTVQNAARMEVFRRQPSTQFVEWSAILDNRTSAICQSLSGRIWGIDDPHPTPPAHMRCRSILLPRKNDTDPALHMVFHTWLAKQPPSVQDEALQSRARGELYRSGKIKPQDLYRLDGSFKTLAELKASDADILRSQ